jgi:hypothetical protein
MLAGSSILVQLGLSYVLEHDEDIPLEKLELLETVLTSYLSGMKTASQSAHIFRNTIGTSDPFARVLSIVQTADTPIPDFSGYVQTTSPNRKCIRPWAEYESQRLLAGIYRFGTEDWGSVSSFVGNGRTRSQCSQRWFRGLNPTICKERWTVEEEEKLGRLVSKYGTKRWTKVAGEMENRSDVQCRYHYIQMGKGMMESEASPSKSILESKSLPIGLLMNKKVEEEGKKVVLPSIEDLLNGNRSWQTSVSLETLPKVRSIKMGKQ